MRQCENPVIATTRVRWSCVSSRLWALGVPAITPSPLCVVPKPRRSKWFPSTPTVLGSEKHWEIEGGMWFLVLAHDRHSIVHAARHSGVTQAEPHGHDRSTNQASLCRLLSSQPMDTEADLQFRPRTGKAASAPLLPEVEAYLQLLTVIFLMNSKRYKEVPGPWGGHGEAVGRPWMTPVQWGGCGCPW